MALIDQIAGLDLLNIEAPEWGENGEPLKIYFRPFTLADGAKINKHAKGNEHEIMAYTLIFKALDTDGKPLFNLSDKHTLMNSVDGGTIAEIVYKMNTTTAETIEGHKKK